ncbi:MAG: DUF721 domain-containing protein, partial [Actinomycetota bacterium]|nr:DUF721 domain-containing protein [Actinomycetota bacterium]
PGAGFSVDDQPLRLRDVLRSEGKRLGIESAVETGAIFSHWRHIVGDSVAAHAGPSSLRDGVLRVRADSPVWATEISYLAPEIQRRANDEAGRAVVKEVSVWWAPGGPETHLPGPGERDRGPMPSTDAGGPRRAGDPVGALERARRAWRFRGRRRDGPP